MSDNTEPTAPSNMPADPQTAPQEPGTSQEPPNAIQDAKKYRKRAQEAEGERDQLRAQVQGLQQQLLSQYLAGHSKKLQEGEDFLATTGTSLLDLLTEDGLIDHEKVDAALDQLETQRPYLLQQQPKANVTIGQGRHERVPAKTSWSTALKG